MSTPIPNKLYELNCDGNIVSEKCGLIYDMCELKLNTKLQDYNMKYENGKLVSVNMINKSNADLLDCATNKSSLECIRVNNCKQVSNSSTAKVLDIIRKKTKSRLEDNKCLRVLNPNSFKAMSLFSKYSCELNLENKGINELDKRLSEECAQIDYNQNRTLSCEIDLLLDLLNSETKDKKVINLLQKASCGKAHPRQELIRQNAKFSDFLKKFFTNELSSCNQLKLTDKSIDQLICFKAEEFKFSNFQENSCLGSVYRHVGKLQAEANARDSAPDPRNIAGQPEKESFTLPTEVPVIKNQETLQKIDKLIADNGGEMTPEVAKKAGEIFNSGIYQPTKEFLNSVSQAITGTSGASGSSGNSGRSSSNFKSSNSKSYEIGAKSSGGRGVANITEEVPSAARATALNGKMASGGSNMLAADAENPANAAAANREVGTGNTQNDKKLVGNNFAGGQGFSGVGGPSGSGSSAGVGSAGFSNAGSSDRSQELQPLPSLSSEEKSEITKVVQALKGAESPEDVKSIVTGEDNYQQIKRIVQELEQNKKNANSKSETSNGRNPASAQVSSEVKEFEKTLEKFGIKVYGEAGPGKAVYAPTSVNHVIVIKGNSVQFLNTIRSKK